jgi:hypothetical protein
LTPYHGTEARDGFATRQAKENDHDQDRKRQAGLHLQDRRLPLQSLHLPQLQLLNEEGPRREARPCPTTVPIQTMLAASSSQPSSLAVTRSRA